VWPPQIHKNTFYKHTVSKNEGEMPLKKACVHRLCDLAVKKHSSCYACTTQH
jgi:hypothetical protein